ncbi:MAG: FKBP-type peptidyl-prolyl cis-trans isomerase [Verrucomicrobiales bacterium]|nr:FKBP-type peptidyl-prolyl cis-trans isomerase [Verrucomicrobiales bacterium]
MKFSHAFVIFGLSTMSVLAQNPPAPKFPLLQTQPSATATSTNEPLDKKKAGYALGMMQATDMKSRDLNIDFPSLLDGMNDVLNDKTPKMTQQEARDLLTKWQAERRNAMMEKRKQEDDKRKAEAPKNKADGEAFLAQKAKESGVVKLDSGMEYKVIKEGTGVMPKAGDTVSALYKGTFVNGKEFDSTANRGNQPFKFVVGQGQVIKGWDEAVQKMKVGSKWEIYVPGDLAYGESGRGQIGPNETLVFELELVDVTPGQKPAASNGGNGQQVVSGEIIKVPSADELKKGAKIEVIHPDQQKK